MWWRGVEKDYNKLIMGNLQGGGNPPRGRPILIYDGECHFCMRQVDRLRRWTGGAVAFEAYQTAAARFPSIPKEAFARSVQLVESDGSVASRETVSPARTV